MNKPRKHAELIKAWADGAIIERLWTDPHHKDQAWLIDNEPDWSEYEKYRIKPEPRPDIMAEVYLQYNAESGVEMWKAQGAKNIRLLFDWYTGELKDAVVMK